MMRLFRGVTTIGVLGVVLCAGLGVLAMELGALLSPSQVVYTARAGYYTGIYLTDVRQGITTNLTHSLRVPAHSPTWSPDGERVAFVMGYHPETVIFVYDLATGEFSRLGDSGVTSYADRLPRWSPDGRYVAFLSSMQQPPSLLIYDAHSDEIIDTTLHVSTEPAWSPDGTKIAVYATVDDERGLHILDLTNDERRFVAEAEAVRSLWWSPDGTRLVFGTLHPEDYLPHVHLLMLEDGSVFDMGAGIYPSWSPDGSQVAFWRNHDGANSPSLMVADAAGGEPRLVMASAPEQTRLSLPMWSPDGTRLMFTYANLWSGDGTLAVVGVDGRRLSLTSIASVSEQTPYWQPVVR